jgi:hypothetical protein
MEKRSLMLWVLLGLLCASPARAQTDSTEREKTIPELVLEQADLAIGGIGCSGFGTPSSDLASVVSASWLVVKRRIGKVSCRLTDDQRAIVTDVQVDVLDLLHNGTPGTVSKSLTVVLAGGRMQLPGGTVEVSGGNYPISAHPRTGEVYILFLETDPQAYTPVEGALGVYRVRDGKIIPAATDHPLYGRYWATELTDFEAEVKRLTQSTRRRN